MINKWNEFVISLNEEADGGTYVVKKGDNLTKIAKAQGMNAKTAWKQIYNLNKGVIGRNPNLIKPGQTLKLPSAGSGANNTPNTNTSYTPSTVTQTPTSNVTQTPTSNSQTTLDQSKIFSSQDIKTVDEIILQHIKDGKIYLDFKKEKNSRGIEKVDVVVELEKPISDSDKRILELYFTNAGLKLSTSENTQKVETSKKYSYRYIPESGECTEDVPVSEGNHLSYFLHYYYLGDLVRTKFLGFKGKKYEIKGKPVDQNTLKMLDEFTQALFYKKRVIDNTSPVTSTEPTTPTQKPSNEESKMFSSEDIKSVDETIIQLIKERNIYLDKKSLGDIEKNRNSNGVKIIDVIVKSEKPISDFDSRILKLYLKNAGFKDSPELIQQKKEQEKQNKKVHYYRFVPESDERTENVEPSEGNHLSYFFHYYYDGKLKERGWLKKLFRGKGYDIDRKDILDENSRKILVEITQALIYRESLRVKESISNNYNLRKIHNFEQFTKNL